MDHLRGSGYAHGNQISSFKANQLNTFSSCKISYLVAPVRHSLISDRELCKLLYKLALCNWEGFTLSDHIVYGLDNGVSTFECLHEAFQPLWSKQEVCSSTERSA